VSCRVVSCRSWVGVFLSFLVLRLTAPAQSGEGMSSISAGAPVQVGQRRNPDATVYVGDLDPQVDEEVLWELFLQVGPVAYTHIPRDKVYMVFI
jgi:RNA recognition motif-containing protein